MFRVESYINNLISLLQQNFKERLLYVGLQGSYLRNEADENSDIDIMVIIDNLLISDLDIYRNLTIINGNADKSCGFICGKSELANWNPCEICQLIHTTKDYYGKLKDFVPTYTLEDVRNYIKISLNNLYHEICHRYIHSSREKNILKLPITYKSIFFILQNIYYLNTGEFPATKKELLTRLGKEDQKVLLNAIELKNSVEYNFDDAFHTLFEWCKNSINSI